MTATITSERVICALDDVAEQPCRAYTVGRGDWLLSGFAERQGHAAFACQNRYE